jgi:hypothetical protein
MPQSTVRAVKNLIRIAVPRGGRKPERVYVDATKTTRYKQKRNRGRARTGGSAGMGRSQLAINLGIRDQMVEDAVNKRGGR